MPTVLRILNLLWMIHTNDHEPAHVTVFKGTPDNFEAKARVEMKTGRIMSSQGFSSSSLKRISELTIKYSKRLQGAWDETRPQK